MLDLDFFKQVNDRYGHLAGDAALRHFCDQLRACVRGGDAIGRLGGEEFLVLLDGDDPGTALAVCDRLREALRNHALEFGDDPDTVGQRRHRAFRAGRHGHLGRDPARRPGAVPGQARGP